MTNRKVYILSQILNEQRRISFFSNLDFWILENMNKCDIFSLNLWEFQGCEHGQFGTIIIELYISYY